MSHFENRCKVKSGVRNGDKANMFADTKFKGGAGKRKEIQDTPVPRQYLHLLCSCCFTLFISTTIKAEITPTAPPENEATIGSTWLHLIAITLVSKWTYIKIVF